MKNKKRILLYKGGLPNAFKTNTGQFMASMLFAHCLHQTVSKAQTLIPVRRSLLMLQTAVVVCALLYATSLLPAKGTNAYLAQFLTPSKEALQDANGEHFIHFVSFLPFY